MPMTAMTPGGAFECAHPRHVLGRDTRMAAQDLWSIGVGRGIHPVHQTSHSLSASSTPLTPSTSEFALVEASFAVPQGPHG